MSTNYAKIATDKGCALTSFWLLPSSNDSQDRVQRGSTAVAAAAVACEVVPEQKRGKRVLLAESTIDNDDDSDKTAPPGKISKLVDDCREENANETGKPHNSSGIPEPSLVDRSIPMDAYSINLWNEIYCRDVSKLVSISSLVFDSFPILSLIRFKHFLILLFIMLSSGCGL